jgi:UDP:flavonoid glycosyltransferase YjiC (YdhE family)
VARAVQEVRQLLEPRYTVRATEVGAIVRAENGPQRACDAIETLLTAAR